MSRLSEVLDRLAATIEARKGADAASSYTAQLLADPARAKSCSPPWTATGPRSAMMCPC